MQYTLVSTNVTLNAGMSTQNVTIPILDNGVDGTSHELVAYRNEARCKYMSW